MFEIVFDRTAEKDLSKIPLCDRERILGHIQMLSSNPFSHKKLRGKLKGSYSLRVWPHRIIYMVYLREKLIQIIRIGHRQGIYE